MLDDPLQLDCLRFLDVQVSCNEDDIPFSCCIAPDTYVNASGNRRGYGRRERDTKDYVKRNQIDNAKLVMKIHESHVDIILNTARLGIAKNLTTVTSFANPYIE